MCRCMMAKLTIWNGILLILSVFSWQGFQTSARSVSGHSEAEQVKVNDFNARSHDIQHLQDTESDEGSSTSIHARNLLALYSIGGRRTRGIGGRPGGGGAIGGRPGGGSSGRPGGGAFGGRPGGTIGGRPGGGSGGRPGGAIGGHQGEPIGYHLGEASGGQEWKEGPVEVRDLPRTESKDERDKKDEDKDKENDEEADKDRIPVHDVKYDFRDKLMKTDKELADSLDPMKKVDDEEQQIDEDGHGKEEEKQKEPDKEPERKREDPNGNKPHYPKQEQPKDRSHIDMGDKVKPPVWDRGRTERSDVTTDPQTTKVTIDHQITTTDATNDPKITPTHTKCLENVGPCQNTIVTTQEPHGIGTSTRTHFGKTVTVNKIIIYDSWTMTPFPDTWRHANPRFDDLEKQVHQNIQDAGKKLHEMESDKTHYYFIAGIVVMSLLAILHMLYRRRLAERKKALLDFQISFTQLRVLKILGTGNFSHVYSVWYQPTESQSKWHAIPETAIKAVAKLLVPEEVNGGEASVFAGSIQCSADEMILRKLHNENIVHVYGICTDFETSQGDQVCPTIATIFEHMELGDCQHFVRNTSTHHQPSEFYWMLTSIFLDVASALVYLHSKAIVHRDIASRNVLLKYETRPGRLAIRAKLGDFGLAKRQKRRSLL